mmetsp:Transcript_10325/g.22721  ORF Transcript_10325/g.22721 Transcript_10325/m.22721 type:complete len:245 (-) Transcript_10325:144-878(-)
MIDFKTIEDIPSSHIKEKQSIYGRIAQVLDADTLRIRHVRNVFGLAARRARHHGSEDGNMEEDTLKIRIYGVKAPDLDSKFSDDARMFTETFFQTHTMVKVTFLKRHGDHVIARVDTEDQLQSFGVSGAMPRDFTLELARAGWARIAKGGEFNGRRGLIDKTIDIAKRKHRGIWSCIDSGSDHSCSSSGVDPLIDRTIDIVPYHDDEQPHLWGTEDDPVSKQRHFKSKLIARRAVDKAVALLSS